MLGLPCVLIDRDADSALAGCIGLHRQLERYKKWLGLQRGKIELSLADGERSGESPPLIKRVYCRLDRNIKRIGDMVGDGFFKTGNIVHIHPTWTETDGKRRRRAETDKQQQEQKTGNCHSASSR